MTAGCSSTQITYMSRKGQARNYGYAEIPGLDAKLLELNYEGRVAMYVLMPNTVEGKNLFLSS